MTITWRLQCLVLCVAACCLGQPKAGMLTADKIKSLPKNFQLDLLLLRLNPSLLNDKRVLQIFILLNNCNGPSDIRGRLKSEFDYPGLAAFYREKAASILANVPGSVTEVTVHLGPFYFGEYDMRKKAFPFSDVTGGKSAVDFDTVGLDSGTGDALHCGDSARDQWYGPPGMYPHSVSFKPVNFASFPMDETAARDFVSAHGQDRAVSFGLDLVILESPPDGPESRVFRRPNQANHCLQSQD